MKPQNIIYIFFIALAIGITVFAIDPLKPQTVFNLKDGKTIEIFPDDSLVYYKLTEKVGSKYYTSYIYKEPIIVEEGIRHKDEITGYTIGKIDGIKKETHSITMYAGNSLNEDYILKNYDEIKQNAINYLQKQKPIDI